MGDFGPKDIAALIERSRVDLDARIKTQIADWGLGTRGNWSVDLDEGTICFTDEERGTLATAPVQIAGSYDALDETWLWSWANPSIPLPLTADAKVVQAFGEKHAVRSFTSAQLECTEEQARNLVALTYHLAKAEGAYLGRNGSTCVLMTFGKVSILKMN